SGEVCMSTALKDQFFTEAFYTDLATTFTTHYPAFVAESFLAAIYTDDWNAHPLMTQMRRTTTMLHDYLPADYRAALAIIREVAPALAGYGFEKLIFSEYVALYGLDDWDASLPALEVFTQMMSAEFAVRPFIMQDPPRMMAQMLAWADHPSEHVRRLASEGSRPRLPWGIALPVFKADPAPILPVLEKLKQDPSETVRRSVANNLNDIAKDNPQVVIDVLRAWSAIETPEMEWLIRHALRTLIKQGDPGALALLGYDAPAITVRNLMLQPLQIALGETVQFSFEVESVGQAAQDLVIDYVLHLVRARGKMSEKVFKLTKRTLAPGETVTLSGQQSFRPITTRKYYPGTHAIAIQINGQECARQEFEVTE
ncbi:MAG: hypothetical protein JXA10_01795, partial [Anaerolineae bacterium]|nr:hypothetical protein [Anaerolineae bacterium]